MPAHLPVIRAHETRRTDTPNATMTTLASPSLGPTNALSLWQVEMAAGSSGPLHVFDSEQVFTVLEGTIAVDLEGAQHDLLTGDTLILRAGCARRISSPGGARLLVCGQGDAVVSVPGEDADRGTPPWIG